MINLFTEPHALKDTFEAKVYTRLLAIANAEKANADDSGDMLIYSGCDLEHWREEFKGKDCGQVFLHYNRAKSKTAKENYLDKRHILGAPAWFKGVKLTKIKK